MLHFRGYENRMKELEQAHISKEKCEGFFNLLQQCERPLICAGGGVICGNASEQLRQFSATFKIPVVTTLMGIGSIDTTDSLSMHMLGMHGMAYANYAVMDCDFLITIGARFDDRVAGKVQEFAPKARFVAHIDIDAAEIGKVKSVTWSHVGAAREALIDLTQHGKKIRKDFSKWLAHVADLKTQHVRNYDRDSEKIQPHHVIECLYEITQGEAIVCTGVGQHQMWAAQYLDFKHPRSLLTSGSMGTMGFGLPAAIGAQAAFPDRLVIDIDGDGSMRMNLGELETATTYNLPIKVLLLNNHGDGMVRQWQKLYFGNRFSGSDKSLRQKDFVKTAQADGYAFAVRINDKAAIKSTLKKFVEFDGPAFLEIMIDPEACVYPMIGPGMGYKEMITGDFIIGRSPAEDILEDKTKLVDAF
jgi:acetolactate synthase-1/2/3 large subunit